MSNKQRPKVSDSQLTSAGWVAIVLLLALLAWAAWYATAGWNTLADTEISTTGWVFLALGIAATLIVGGGLMALLFYSSRNNLDR